MKSFVAASTFISCVSSFSHESHYLYRNKFTELKMSESTVTDEVVKTIHDPMGLYPKDSVERKENVAVVKDDVEPIMVEKKIRDPMGLYTENTPERQEGLIQDMDMTVGKKDNAIYDPLNLYPENASERKEGIINPLEEVQQVKGIVKDPLDLYGDKSEVDIDTEMSQSLPFLRRPKMLDGTLPGDRGFDPLNFATDSNRLEWFRSAEIRHARLAMLVS